MKNLCVSGLMLLCIQWIQAQEYVIDYQHLVAVSQNASVRSGAEVTHDQYLGKINNNINDLNTNVGSVVLAQTMIYQGLSNVNSALKDGLAVKNIAVIIADMTGYINQALAMARSEPYLLVFAGNMAAEMRRRSLALVTDVSGYVLKEGNNVLDGLAYGTWKAMYWAKERGVIASLNPFANFISQDTRIVDQIIQNAKYLKQ
jgi:hypothetical protein